jgi:hypothetical protein
MPYVNYSFMRRRVAQIIAEHGESMTLKRRTSGETFDSLAVKGKMYNPRLQNERLDGEIGAVQRIRISNAEIAASSLPDQGPTEKDQIVDSSGVTFIIDVVDVDRDGDTVLGWTLEVSAAGGH